MRPKLFFLILLVLLYFWVVYPVNAQEFSYFQENSDVFLEEQESEKIATEDFVYSLWGEKHSGSREVTVKILAQIMLNRHLEKNKKLTYENYEYYRSCVKDTSDRVMLKAFSEGLIPLMGDASLQPERKLTRKEVEELAKRLDFPEPPIRPQYVEIESIPILMYHEINYLPRKELAGLYVSPENFIKQLEALQQSGYNTVTMEQVYRHWMYKDPLPPKPIVLTFDDGYKSHLFAARELAKRGMTGTFYIITGKKFLSHINFLNEREIKEIYDLGMEIGSHTVNHLDARYNGEKVMLREYRESKAKLEQILGQEIRHFCYPGGGVASFSVKNLKDAGYCTAVRTTYGKASKKQNIFELKRIRVTYWDGISSFLNKCK